jgi:carboxyl-terminal processing protease
MRKWFAILFFLVFVVSSRVLAQYPPGQEKAIIATRMIELNHYSPRPVDDSFSVSLFKAMMNAADARRLLFTAAEYKLLSAYTFKLDDELKGNGWAFIDLFTSLYKKSLIRADSVINAVLQKPFDFTVNESIGFFKEPTWNFAATLNELASRWTRHCKLEALQKMYDIITDDSTNNNFSKEAIARQETKVRDKIKTAERKKLKGILEHPEGFAGFITELYLNSIATSFDPHTNYFSPEGKEQFQSELSTEGYSFGLEFDENEKGKIIIDRLVPGGPAWKTGELNKGDELLQLYWENKEPGDISSMSTEEIYEMIEQPSQERLVVKVKKADNTIKTVTLRKEKINNEENVVRSFVLKGEKKIGYILLPGFYTEWENEGGSGCANDVAKEIIKLKRENIDGLIIDVRFNGGGSVGEGLELTGIFVDEGPLAAQKDKAGKVIYYKDPNRGVIYDGPLALMVNGQSASASEMMAASLQDYNRAVIVGSATYGKASVQQLFPLDTTFRPNTKMPDNVTDVLKITIAKFYRLNGESIQLKGVKPDIILPDAFDGLEIGEKFSRNPLASDSVKKNSYYKPLPPFPVNELAKRSADRISNNDAFQSIQKIAEAQSETDKLNSMLIPLRWDEFEKWIKQHEPDMKFSKDKKPGKENKFEAVNNQLDKQRLQNNDYEKEINKKWLENIAEDIYIEEAFLVVTDLINLQKPSTKN